MIYVTGIKVYSDLRLLWGVLLDPITPSDLPQEVFKAFFVSDTIREINCEVPKYIAGLGSTSEGLSSREFETQLHGLCVYAHERPSWLALLTGMAENRTEIVTDSDPSDFVFPAFLATERVTAPLGDNVVVALEIGSLDEFPDSRARATNLRSILERPGIRAPAPIGTVLPVNYASEQGPVLAALELVRSTGGNKFEAVVYHEEGKPAPLPGNLLERSVSRRNAANPEMKLEFSATIGRVLEVGSRIRTNH
jgi:hypothetical protein